MSDINSGAGWYEIVTRPGATTTVVYVYEDGSIYSPEGYPEGRDELAVAVAQGDAHRLVRADDLSHVQADAVREAQREWQLGGWAGTPRHADRIADRMAASQYASDWLREWADKRERGEG